MTRRTFRVWAPHAARAELVLEGARHAMHRHPDGNHEVETHARAGARYGYSLDGGDPLPDPRSRAQPDGVHGLSALVDPRPPAPSAWRGRDLADAVIYELHVGTFTAEGTFDAAIARLDHLVALGIDAVELMPVAEFPGDRGWGYDGVDLYAPHHAYGGPEGLDRLIAACHERGIAVVVDVVYNHLGPDGNHLERFGPYFTDRHHTPWGKALNYDGPDSAPVRAWAIDNTLMWLRDHGADGVRLDAVHAIVDLSATHLVRELTARVEAFERETGRRCWVIAESDLNDPTVVDERERGGWGCDAQWSDDLHHAVHALLTGERAGYYADFGRVADVAKALRDAFVYDGRPSRFRGAVHGRSADGIPGERFLAYAQTHDQVGNRAKGERLGHIVDGGSARIAAALAILSPFVPMLFMGEEWAAGSPFLYFTDHRDERLARAVSEGRRSEFAHFGWPPGEIVDPQSPEAFERSRLDWSELEREPHRAMLEWYRALIRLRREAGRADRGAVEVAFDEDARWLRAELGRLTLVFALEGARVPLARAGGELALASQPDIRCTELTADLPPRSVAVVRH